MSQNWTRYEEAKRLKDTGLSFKSVGEALGVTEDRARQMVNTQKGREHFAKLPREWFYGLSLKTATRLQNCGFSSKDACMILMSDKLPMWRGSVVLPGWEEDRNDWKWSNKKLSISIVNEVRVWIGAKPFVPARKDTK